MINIRFCSSNQVTATMPTTPGKVDALLTALFAEIRALSPNGPDVSDQHKVQQSGLQSLRRSIKENGTWAALPEGAVLTDSDPAKRLAQESKIGELTVEETKATAQLYFDTGNMYR